MSWFRLSLRSASSLAEKQSPASPLPSPKLGEGEGEGIASSLQPCNDEATDPGIDVYIPPSFFPSPLVGGRSQSSRHLGRQWRCSEGWGEGVWSPIRWVQQLLSKRRALEEAKEIIAKVDLLYQSPDSAIRYFFDNDLPALVQVSQRYPALVQKMLSEKLENSPTRQHSEPWYRLVQVACGDAQAILPALDGLC